MHNESNLLNDIILTGIPRSGTSYLCASLHKVRNCVVINEPYNMSIDLNKTKRPDAILNFHYSVRADILQKKSIKNKLFNGKMIEDTVLLQQYESYHPRIKSQDFLLGSKNTLGYLARLQEIKSLFPKTPILACIRNPIDTIASWKRSFPHLEQASFATQHVIGSKNDIHLSSWQKEQVLAISKEPKVSYRRAMLWAYLARWIWKHKHSVNVIHYEALVCNPNRVLREIFDVSIPSFPFSLTEELLPSTVRCNKRVLLDREDREAIEKICSPLFETFL